MTEVTKKYQAGCVSSDAQDIRRNRTCLLSSTWEKCTTAHSRRSCLEKKCWCGTTKNIHSTLESPASSLTWEQLQQTVSSIVVFLKLGAWQRELIHVTYLLNRCKESARKIRDCSALREGLQLDQDYGRRYVSTHPS